MSDEEHIEGEPFYLELPIIIVNGSAEIPSFTVPSSSTPISWDRLIVEQEDWPETLPG